MRFPGTVAECVRVCARGEGRWGWGFVAGNRGQKELAQARFENGCRGFRRPIQGMLASAPAVKKRVKRSEASARAGKASPPPSRGAGSQLTRQPYTTPDLASLGFYSGGRARVGLGFRASRCPRPGFGVWWDLPSRLGALKGSESLLPLARFGEVATSPWHPRLHARPNDPSPCSETASSISRPEKGGDPGIHSRVRARVPTKPRQRALCASCKVSARC